MLLLYEDLQGPRAIGLAVDVKDIRREEQHADR
jgi:hypothetical protein